MPMYICWLLVTCCFFCLRVCILSNHSSPSNHRCRRRSVFVWLLLGFLCVRLTLSLSLALPLCLAWDKIMLHETITRIHHPRKTNLHTRSHHQHCRHANYSFLYPQINMRLRLRLLARLLFDTRNTQYHTHNTHAYFLWNMCARACVRARSFHHHHSASAECAIRDLHRRHWTGIIFDLISS